jgi:hypothetical protein
MDLATVADSLAVLCGRGDLVKVGARKRSARVEAPVKKAPVEAPSEAVRSALMAVTYYHVRGHVSAPCEMYNAERDLKDFLQRAVWLGGIIRNYPQDMVLEALEKQMDKVRLVNESPPNDPVVAHVIHH